jgi:hypothetical protein
MDYFTAIGTAGQQDRYQLLENRNNAWCTLNSAVRMAVPWENIDQAGWYFPRGYVEG